MTEEQISECFEKLWGLICTEFDSSDATIKDYYEKGLRAGVAIGANDIAQKYKDVHANHRRYLWIKSKTVPINRREHSHWAFPQVYLTDISLDHSIDTQIEEGPN